MAEIQAEIKRGFLRSLYRQTSESQSLQDVLDAYQTTLFTPSFQSGRMVSATSQAGHNVQFIPPAIGSQFTQDQVFSLSEELEQVYSDAIVNLSSAGTTSPTDSQIFSEMMGDPRLTTITDVQKDYTLLRWPGRY